jgi:cystathionine beta-synthase
MHFINSIAEAIGNTPLLKLSRIKLPPGHNIFAKCEFLNPGGSVKDRIGFHMVECAEREGKLTKGQLIVEATGGNTGIGLAMAANLKGYKLLCVMTEKVGKKKVGLMKVLGAETLVVPGGKAIDDEEHYINKAKRLAKERGGWFSGQFENAHNIEAHYKTTGPELWEQTGGRIDALVAGIGTGGTLCGAGKYLKEKNPNVHLVLADPRGSLLSGWQAKTEKEPAPYLVEGIGGDFIPEIVDLSLIDKSIEISDQRAIEITHQLARKESVFVGGSSGCIVAAAIQYCVESGKEGLNVVAVLPSTGHLYTDTVFDAEWLKPRNMPLD